MTSILFHSSMGGVPWGGSEELWSGAAIQIARQGTAVAASVQWWKEPAEELSAVASAGVRILERRPTLGWARLQSAVRRRVGASPRCELQAAISATRPDLVVVSNGGCLPSPEAMTRLVRGDVPYLNIAQANSPEYFVPDASLPLVRDYVRQARDLFFVSEDNCRLFERQIGMRIGHAAIVRNPYKVPRDVDHSLLQPASGEPVRLACVARLHPSSKGQDVLLDVLSLPHWRSRSVRTAFFGRGPHEGLVRDLVQMHGLNELVHFCGTSHDIPALWRTHQALVLPSRYEGLPLAVVEAMLCGRIVITTDAGGAKELIGDGETGFVARGNSVDAFDTAMQHAWDLRADWPRIGAAARVRALAQMPENPCAALAERILDNVASARTGGGTA